ncbi:T. brucei spp.-specific protein [Trypanosoma brucei gambiense DAL972]|uniref:T. brucei spp.-specific protein n=1 Tax=Trypanosoma brucei gambiense (strain MHOM/CI/86/DAL972) TaxID=679716 RepID=C9ZNQ2_TRYB9|nr:T. brucei spp.-specific protein [Trypanosoma brucei gambiense DAL972]CBH11030.1 T. brucei spp.-specific protein [Trypanosoma brucei gambiense DAL972]|eukprot:XP_011773317.1 T. brucei spp.-specific protein [Trypanosoma brucei gambiense DAL972]
MLFDCTLLSLLGAMVAAIGLYRVVQFVHLTFFSTGHDLKRRYSKAGDWAVVTGGTEGIGRAVALDLANRGFNVCVISRTQSKLDEVVAEIEKCGTRGHSIAFDFATAGEAEYKMLFAKLDSLAVGLLVNNVGVNYTYANYFDEADLVDDLRIIKVNCEATTRMTKFFAPRMKARRAGGIVLLGSFSAVTPAPLLATYAGTKAFNVSFGDALFYELKKFGVDVLVVTPNLVVSRMTQGASTRAPKETFLTVGAAAMARQTLNQLGVVNRTAGHRNHIIIEAIARLLPESLRGEKMLAMHESIKKRAERKAKQ